MFERLREFEWERHGNYEIVPSCRFTCSDGEVKEFGRRIIHRTKEGHPYRPLEKFPDLYLVFANVRDEERLLWFVRHFGPLTDPGLVATTESPHFTSEIVMVDGQKLAEKVFVPGDLIEECLKWAEWFNNVLKCRFERSERFIKLIEKVQYTFPCHLYVVPDLGTGAELVLEPNSLLDAILLQLLESIRNGRISSECLNCGEWFAKKSGAKFCGDRCKDAHHNNQKRMARLSRATSGPE